MESINRARGLANPVGIISDKAIDWPVLDLGTEQRIELIKNRGQMGLDLVERFSGIASPLQGYLVGRIELHIHLSSTGDGICLRCRDGRNQTVRLDLDEMPMLIFVGEFVENLEQRETIIRLKPLNQCDLFGCQMLQAPLTGPVRSFGEILFALADRKLSSLLFLSSIMKGKIVDDVIQRDAGMKGILTYEASPFWRNLQKQVRQSLEAITLKLSKWGLECTINPPLDQQFKLVELFPCPLYSDLRFDQSFHVY